MIVVVVVVVLRGSVDSVDSDDTSIPATCSSSINSKKIMILIYKQWK